jgi:hypothetical protein
MVKIVGATIAIVAALLQTRGIASAIAGGASMSTQNVFSRMMTAALPPARAAKMASAVLKAGAGTVGRAAGAATSGAGHSGGAAANRARATAFRGGAEK